MSPITFVLSYLTTMLLLFTLKCMLFIETFKFITYLTKQVPKPKPVLLNCIQKSETIKYPPDYILETSHSSHGHMPLYFCFSIKIIIPSSVRGKKLRKLS